MKYFEFGQEHPELMVLLHGGETRDMTLYLKNTDAQERELLLRGCLINYYAAKNEERHG